MDLDLKRLKHIFLPLIFLGLIACREQQFPWKNKKENTLEFIEEKDSVLRIDNVSKNVSYGFSPKNPVKLGIKNLELAASYPEKYFRSMTGPNGEKLIFKRIKSCCPFKTVNSSKSSYQNVAVLEVYEVRYQGLEKPIIVYLNFFDQGRVEALKGYKIVSIKR